MSTKLNLNEAVKLELLDFIAEGLSSYKTGLHEHRTCLELLMMLLLQKLLTCIRSRIDNGLFSRHQQSRVKVFSRVWIGMS